ASDGAYPDGNSLIQSGSTLYGTTYQGGTEFDTGFGTVFQIGTDGTGFSLLHSFLLSEGGNPMGSLIQSGSTLYGVTGQGGVNGGGTIFQIGTDSTGFSLLHSFANPFGYTGSDGASPTGSLIQSGSKLFGMTLSGGNNGKGTIFSLTVA